MSEVLASLAVVVGANTDEFERSLSKVSASMTKTGDDLEKIGWKMTKFLTAPIIGFGATVIHVAGDFQASMKRVEAITGETGVALENLNDQAKQLGISTVFTAREAGDRYVTFLGTLGRFK